jgi:hypothetical protein
MTGGINEIEANLDRHRPGRQLSLYSKAAKLVSSSTRRPMGYRLKVKQHLDGVPQSSRVG